jgi:diguanylate cyclase (GGDEF)-like protein
VEQVPTPAEDAKRPDPSFLERFNLLQESGTLRALEQLRKENRELDTLITDAACLFAIKGVAEMLDFVISRLLDRFIPARLVFLIESPRGDRLMQYCYRNLRPSEAEFPEERYGALKRFFLSSPYPVSYADLSGRLGSEALGDRVEALAPELLFPMLGLDGLYGVVILGRKIVGEDYSEAERMYADRIVRFLSIGIQNSQHRDGAMIDSKTGLFNFVRGLEQEIARAARHRASLGVIMIDVDHFKRFNDTWGHLAGDAVLEALADTLRAAVRAEDVPARFGGEEFCVIVVQCDAASILEVAERIRRSIEAMSVEFESERLKVTASLGCCLVGPDSRLTVPLCIERADKALYASKAGGRNRSTLYRAGLLDRAAILRSRAAR